MTSYISELTSGGAYQLCDEGISLVQGQLSTRTELLSWTLVLGVLQSCNEGTYVL